MASVARQAVPERMDSIPSLGEECGSIHAFDTLMGRCARGDLGEVMSIARVMRDLLGLRLDCGGRHRQSEMAR